VYHVTAVARPGLGFLRIILDTERRSACSQPEARIAYRGRVRRCSGHARHWHTTGGGKLQNKIITWTLKDLRTRTGSLVKSGVYARGAAPRTLSEVNFEISRAQFCDSVC
jgi:hypothetical protein